MASPSGSSTGALRLYGHPQRLTMSSSTLADGNRYELVLPDELSAYAEGGVVRLRVPRQRAGTLRVSLDRSAPPGGYAAELRSAGTVYPVNIEIAPAPRLRVFPLSVDFAGAPGAASQAQVILANEGNVAIVVPERAMVGIYDDDGLEFAFADTYRQDTDDPEKLLGHWLRKLREGYGGLLKLQIASGAGPLAPGAEQRLTVKTKLSDQLKPGHSYHGIWRLEPVHYRLTVTIHR